MKATVDESMGNGNYRIHCSDAHNKAILTFDQVIHAMNRGEDDGTKSGHIR